MSTGYNTLKYDSKIITLRSVFDKAGIKYIIQPCKDKNGKYPPCVKKVDSNGDMILSESDKNAYANNKAAFFPEDHFFEITSGKTYNLDDMWEAAEWEAIKNCPLIAPERDAKDAKGNLLIDGPRAKGREGGRNGVAELYVDRPGLKTTKDVNRKRLVHMANSYIWDDEQGEDGQRKMARILGRNMSNQPLADVLDFLTNVADKDPQKIIDLYTGGDLELRILFIDARDRDVIIYKDQLYNYNSAILGATDEAALLWMKNPKNKKTLSLIKRETYPEYYPDETTTD